MTKSKRHSYVSSEPKDRLALRKCVLQLFHLVAPYAKAENRKVDIHHWIDEVERRLIQIDLLAKEVDRVDRQMRKKIDSYAQENGFGELPAELCKREQIWQLVLVESYYLIAWRIVDALKHINGFSKIKAKGISDVRNRLIQHPESNGIAQWSFSTVGFNADIKLKPFSDNAKVRRFLDDGFAVNDLRLHAEILELSIACDQRKRILFSANK